MAKKNVAFKIRIDEELRRAFVDACQAHDRPAAQVVREFMRRYVADKAIPIQRDAQPVPVSPKRATKPGVRRKTGG